MPSSIALLIFVSFIFYLMANDIKRNHGVSIAIWIPLIWLLRASTRPIAQWLKMGSGTRTATTVMEGNPIDATFFTIIGIIGIWILMKRKKRCLEIITENSLLIIFIIPKTILFSISEEHISLCSVLFNQV